MCFIVDAFSRRIVGWRVTAHMRTEMVLDALEMARAARGAGGLVGLITRPRRLGNSRPCASPNGSTRSGRDPRSRRWPTPKPLSTVEALI
jgi:transposase InsO family protein